MDTQSRNQEAKRGRSAEVLGGLFNSPVRKSIFQNYIVTRGEVGWGGGGRMGMIKGKETHLNILKTKKIKINE